MLPHINSGKLRPLAVTAKTRSPALPNVPTFSESGYPNYEAINWFGILAPKGVSPDIVKRLNSEIVRIVNAVDVKERYVTLGAEPLSATAEQTEAFIRNEIEKWAKIVKISGARID